MKVKPEIRMLYQPNCDYHFKNLAFDLSSFLSKVRTEIIQKEKVLRYNNGFIAF